MDGRGGLAVIEQRRERYLRSPRLTPTADGATLHVIAWEPDGERVLAFDLSPEGTPGEARVVTPPTDAIAAFAPGEAIATTDDPGVDDAAEAGAYRVRVVHDGSVSEVRLFGPDQREVVVWRARGIAAAPAVAPVADGAWVAFHHDVREDRGEPDVAKWVALRFVDADGRVLEPEAPMRDRNRDQEGEEQSFEFPTLSVGEDGALAIFGRGSHRFYRQDVGAEGFGPRVPIGPGGWGCRGRRVAVARSADGGLLTARREREGIVIDRVEGPSGGRPALVPAEVDANHVGRITARVMHAAGEELASADGRGTFFGDIHQHSAHSDGIGTAAEAYLRARFTYGDDFCALTDHESFLGKRIGPGEWAYLSAVADRYDEPGRFATLIAYEWTGRMYPGPGHKVVYLPRSGTGITSRDDVPEGVDLVSRVRELGGFAVPHHVGWTGADAAAHDPSVQPVWEICSCHGCYEHPGHPLGQRGELADQQVDSMLRAGLRFGFIACSDSHGLLFHHGIARKRDPFRTGLTAVQAPACTRTDIFEAIGARRCYATSGVRILLDLRVGDAPMGSVLAPGGPVPVRAEVLGTAPVAWVELVGSAGVLATVEPGVRRASIEASVSDAWVYARVTQVDGEMAWSSPVFLNR